MEQGEIVVYKTADANDFQLEVRVEDETVWLNRLQMAQLFDRDVKTIGKHISNALKEELHSVPVVAKFATTAQLERSGIENRQQPNPDLAGQQVTPLNILLSSYSAGMRSGKQASNQLLKSPLNNERITNN
jgi:myo-inositol-1-phosphate synthase